MLVFAMILLLTRDSHLYLVRPLELVHIVLQSESVIPVSQFRQGPWDCEQSSFFQKSILRLCFALASFPDFSKQKNTSFPRPKGSKEGKRIKLQNYGKHRNDYFQGLGFT